MKKLFLLLAALVSLASTPALADLENHSILGRPPAYDTVELIDIPSNFTLEDYLTDNVNYNGGCSTGLEAACTPGTIAGTNGGDEASFRTFCEPSHLAYDDPILYPGEPGNSHLHQFYGNTLVDADSTYETLRTTGSSTCGSGKVNRSGYWHPAVLKDGVDIGNGPETVAIKPTGSIVYYKVNRANIGKTVRIPRGFNYIFGFNMNTGVKGPGFRGWFCEGTSAKADYLANSDGTPAFDCPSTNRIEMGFTAPGCWDGENITSANGRDHVAFQTGTGAGDPCPASHPYMITHFSFRVFFSHNGPDDYKTWYLASDRMPGYPVFRNGESGHTDWFGAWDYGTVASPGMMIKWLSHCNGLTGNAADVRSCIGTQFGNTQRGCHQIETKCPATDIVQQTSSLAVPEGERYQQIPPDPMPAIEDPVEGHQTGIRIRRHHH